MGCGSFEGTVIRPRDDAVGVAGVVDALLCPEKDVRMYGRRNPHRTVFPSPLHGSHPRHPGDIDLYSMHDAIYNQPIFTESKG